MRNLVTCYKFNFQNNRFFNFRSDYESIELSFYNKRRIAGDTYLTRSAPVDRKNTSVARIRFAYNQLKKSSRLGDALAKNQSHVLLIRTRRFIKMISDCMLVSTVKLVGQNTTVHGFEKPTDARLRKSQAAEEHFA